MSEPPVAFFPEPSPSDSDQDLVPNDPPLSRKRRSNLQKTSQPPSKRQKTTQTTNGAAGSSRRSRSPILPRVSQSTSATAKVKKSGHSQLANVAPAPPRTKVVRRTAKEKQRQRSSSSRSPSPSLHSVLKNTSLSSASAPPSKQKRRDGFDRGTLKSRFTQYAQSAPPKPKNMGSLRDEEVIDLVSDEEPSSKPVTIVDSTVIELSDSSDAESQAMKRSARRKAEKNAGINGSKKRPKEVFTIEDSDDEPSPMKPQAALKTEASLYKPRVTSPPSVDLEMNMASNEGMDVEFGGERSPRNVSPAPDSILGVQPTTPPRIDLDLDEQSGMGDSSMVPTSVLEVRETTPLEDLAPVVKFVPQATANSAVNGVTEHHPSVTQDLTPPSPVPRQDRSPDVGGMADVSLDDDPPAEEGINPEKSKSPLHFHPDGRLSPQTEDPPQALQYPASPPASPVGVPSIPQPGSPTRTKDRSETSLPPESSHDVSLGTAIDAIRQEPTSRFPKLDLSTLIANKRKRRLPALSATASTGTPENTPLKPESRRHATTPGASFLKPRHWDQDSLVQAIITTGQHNTQGFRIGQSFHVEEQMHSAPIVQQVEMPSDENPQPSSEKPERWQDTLAQAIITTGQHNARRASVEERNEDTPTFQLPDAPSNLQASTEASRSPPQPSSLPSIPTTVEQPSMTSLKKEEAVSHSLTSFTADREVIDLTHASEDEGHVSSTNMPEPDRYIRLKKLMGLADKRRSASSAARAENLHAARAPSDGVNNVPESPKDGLTTIESRLPSTASLAEGVAKMDLDSGSPVPLHSKQAAVSHDTADDNPPAMEPVSAVETEPAMPESNSAPSKPPDESFEPPLSPPLERRSYDDAEVYHLEYIGPPCVAPSPVSEEEKAVQDLVAPSHVDSSGSDDMVMATHVFGDNSSSETSEDGPSRDAFLMASSDEDLATGVSRPSSPRRSSRLSSRSASADPLDFVNVGTEEDDNSDFNTPRSPLSAMGRDLPDDRLRLDFPDRDMPDGFDDGADYPVTSWKSYRKDLTNFEPVVYRSEDLVSKLHDYINSYHEEFRASRHMRHVFQSAIRENTAQDEPDAPWIEVTNEVDADPTPPWEFYYSNHMWLANGIDPPDMTKLVGCDCKGKCDPRSETCSCLKRQIQYYRDETDSELFPPGFAYDSKGRLRTVTSQAPVFECNALCSCDDDECMNRVVQHGRKVSVALQKTENKGWGVFATKKIAKGTFIGIYAGEFLRDDECERRGLVYDRSGRTYLLDIDFYYLQVQYVVDAYHAGNFTRFLNNSCDPNCRVIPCYINEPDINKPLLTLFTRRDVAVGEELCFSYIGVDPDNPDDDIESKTGMQGGIKNECRCGAERCVGFMFG